MPNGDDRNDGGLRENVADVDRLQKIGGQLAYGRNQNSQDQKRTNAQKPERQRNSKSRSLASDGRGWRFVTIGRDVRHNVRPRESGSRVTPWQAR